MVMLGKNKLLRGYVGNRTKEVALAAILSSLYVLARYIRIPIVSVVEVDLGTCVWTLSLLVLSYPYVWLFSLLAGVTTPFFPSIVGHIFGYHLFYIMGRALGIRKAKFFIILGPLSTVSVTILCFIYVLPLLPKTLILPALLHSFIEGFIATLIVPVFVSLLEKSNIISLRRP